MPESLHCDINLYNTYLVGSVLGFDPKEDTITNENIAKAIAKLHDLAKGFNSATKLSSALTGSLSLLFEQRLSQASLTSLVHYLYSLPRASGFQATISLALAVRQSMFCVCKCLILSDC